MNSSCYTCATLASHIHFYLELNIMRVFKIKNFFLYRKLQMLPPILGNVNLLESIDDLQIRCEVLAPPYSPPFAFHSPSSVPFPFSFHFLLPSPLASPLFLPLSSFSSLPSHNSHIYFREIQVSQKRGKAEKR